MESRINERSRGREVDARGLASCYRRMPSGPDTPRSTTLRARESGRNAEKPNTRKFPTGRSFGIEAAYMPTDRSSVLMECRSAGENWGATGFNVGQLRVVLPFLSDDGWLLLELLRSPGGRSAKSQRMTSGEPEEDTRNERQRVIQRG